jgi:polyisoprenoid-binding protein YceI
MQPILRILAVIIISHPAYSQTINMTKSKVTFEIGNFGFNTVEGSFEKMSGDIIFDLLDLANSKFDVCVEASTINTKSKKRDNHLKNEDFFDTDKYPKICFLSESISKKEEKYLAQGKLSLHGVTKTVEIPFVFSASTFTGTLIINRYEFNLGSTTSKFMVSEETEIKIICVLNQ